MDIYSVTFVCLPSKGELMTVLVLSIMMNQLLTLCRCAVCDLEIDTSKLNYLS